MSKIQPLDRTAVTEFTIHVADINTRVRQLKGSIAAKVLASSNFVSGDAVIGPAQIFTLSPIDKFVIIHSFESFFLDINMGVNQITNVSCDGLYIFYGALSSVVLKNSTQTRLTYIYS